jgi:hypothetical protein
MSNEKGPGLAKLGPPPRSSVDWFFTPRPGRFLDAADVRLADAEQEEQLQLGVRDFFKYLVSATRRLFGFRRGNS